MGKTAIVTDSNSGITQERSKGLGIHVLAMPFFIDGELFLEDITLTRKEFFDKLEKGSDISTSQPSPSDVQGLWQELLLNYDEIVHIPMSSGLSGSYQTAVMLSEEFEGKVHVVNNQRISVTQKLSVIDAIELRNAGKSGKEIKDILEADKFQSSIYITLETLKYLKKGGRITPTAAALGTILNIKPVLQIRGEQLDAYAKVRGLRSARKIMIEAIQNDFNTTFKDSYDKGEMQLQYAHTCSDEVVEEWINEIRETFPNSQLSGDPLSLSVACHIGSGAIAIACSHKILV